MGICRTLGIAAFVALLLCSCGGGIAAPPTTSNLPAPQAMTMDSGQDYFVVDMRLTRPDGAILDLTERPIPRQVSIDLSFSRALSADEKARFEKLFVLVDDEANPVKGRIEWSSDGTQMTLLPSESLDFNTAYTITGIRPVGFETSFKTMTCGDVDGDGRADFALGAPGAAGGMGKVSIQSGARPRGAPIAEIAGTTEAGPVGSWVAPAGDVNGDGYADVLVAKGRDRQRPEKVMVLSGKALARGSQELLSAANIQLSTGPSPATVGMLAEKTGVSAADRYGAAVAAAGDVSGDGIADFIIGAPGALANTGAAYIYSGADLSGRPLAMQIGDAAGDAFGSAVAGAGDVNNDGKDDLLVGAPQAAGQRGSVHIFSGADITDRAMAKNAGETQGDAFGSSVAGIGDINNDGKAEIIIGAPYFDDGANADAGRVYIFNDSDRFTKPLFTLTGKSVREELGFSVASACPDPAKLKKR